MKKKTASAVDVPMLATVFEAEADDTYRGKKLKEKGCNMKKPLKKMKVKKKHVLPFTQHNKKSV